MELRERVEQLMKPQKPTALPPLTASISKLTNMERLVANRRWLRGAMCFLAFICYGLSLFDEGRVITHSIILVLSLAAEVAIVCIYRVKAHFHGITNRANGERGEVSVFHSPSLSCMLLEMLVWIIQCPPLPDSVNPEWLVWLDGVLFLRFYVLLLYGMNVSHTPVFARAISSLARIRLNYRFFLRTAFLLEHLLMTLGAIAIGVIAFACAYTKAEEVSFGESFYFCVSTVSLAGYSEASPVTFPGRIIAVGVTLLGVSILCWVVGVMNQALALSQAERNLYALFHSNVLCGQVPAQAACLIQRTWKLYRARRDRRNFISRQIAAFLLSQQVITYREMRRELFRQETAFLLSTRTVEDSFVSDSPFGSRFSSPYTSRSTSPVSTPRTKRPFVLFQEVRRKQDSRATTPRGEEYLQVEGDREPLAGFRRENRRPVLSRKPSSIQPQSPVTAAVPGLAELELRLSKLETSLESLVTTAETLQKRFGIVSSVSV